MRTGLLLLAAGGLFGQQVADTEFRPPIAKPAYEQGKGPLVLIDEGHHNFHTATGRYLPFAELLRRDGYVVKGSGAKFSTEMLRGCSVMVISNALNEKNANDWKPPHPSAFTQEEISALREWLTQGGRLLLIADHMPFAGAAEELGKALGVRFENGYSVIPEIGGILVFRKPLGTLKEHAVTQDIPEIATFTGSAFQVKGPAEPLLVFGPGVVSIDPNDASKKVPVTGYWQGAVMRVGKGRLALFGEAAMFSAQLAGPNKIPMGMNAPAAKYNPQFLLNVMRWLTANSD
ncbi:MAG: DUF4350 domain-containing protein [Bryobacteraceae bacterium]|nr:DUF4350 domain-containing protein [Bryobacteraceae bacterium]